MFQELERCCSIIAHILFLYCLQSLQWGMYNFLRKQYLVDGAASCLLDFIGPGLEDDDDDDDDDEVKISHND